MSDERDQLWTGRVRGMMLGLALGDSLGGARGTLSAAGPLRAGVTTQLAAFTAEGVIRGIMRQHHKGICHPPSVVWHAYCRWAALQGIDAEEIARDWAGLGGSWPDGWLARVPLLAERRGSAPATVRALRGRRQGNLETPVTTSSGAHALTRTLPVAAVTHFSGPGPAADLARDCAALTHGDRQAHSAAAAGVAIAALALTAETIAAAVNDTFRVPGVTTDTGTMMAIDQAQQAGSKHPGDKQWMADLAPDATALSALKGAVYVTESFPRREDTMTALRFAARAPHGTSVAAVTGGLLGALHGAEVWPVDLLSRLELVWVMDTLARDLALQITDNPGGSEYDDPRDPHWWDRYPGY